MATKKGPGAANSAIGGSQVPSRKEGPALAPTGVLALVGGDNSLFVGEGAILSLSEFRAIGAAILANSAEGGALAIKASLENLNTNDMYTKLGGPLKVLFARAVLGESVFASYFAERALEGQDRKASPPAAELEAKAKEFQTALDTIVGLKIATEAQVKEIKAQIKACVDALAKLEKEGLRWIVSKNTKKVTPPKREALNAAFNAAIYTAMIKCSDNQALKNIAKECLGMNLEVLQKDRPAKGTKDTSSIVASNQAILKNL